VRLKKLIKTEVTSVSELTAKQKVPRLYDRELVVVNWDAANGDATTSSDQTLGFFRDLGRLRRGNLLYNHGVLLSEAQMVSGILYQEAYDAIFGAGELGVLSSPPTGQGPVGTTARIVPRFGRFGTHPILEGLPYTITSASAPGQRMLFLTGYRGLPGAADKNSEALWWGWFTYWRKGWIPLLNAATEEGKGSDRLCRPVLLAKLSGHGVMIASTMWIAMADVHPLIENIIKLCRSSTGSDERLDRIRYIHSRIAKRRMIGDLVLGLIIFAIATCLSLGVIYGFEHAQGNIPLTIFTAVGLSIATLVTWSFRWYRRYVWERPFGKSVLWTAREAAHRS